MGVGSGGNYSSVACESVPLRHGADWAAPLSSNQRESPDFDPYVRVEYWVRRLPNRQVRPSGHHPNWGQCPSRAMRSLTGHGLIRSDVRRCGAGSTPAVGPRGRCAGRCRRSGPAWSGSCWWRVRWPAGSSTSGHAGRGARGRRPARGRRRHGGDGPGSARGGPGCVVGAVPADQSGPARPRRVVAVGPAVDEAVGVSAVVVAGADSPARLQAASPNPSATTADTSCRRLVARQGITASRAYSCGTRPGPRAAGGPPRAEPQYSLSGDPGPDPLRVAVDRRGPHDDGPQAGGMGDDGLGRPVVRRLRVEREPRGRHLDAGGADRRRPATRRQPPVRPREGRAGVGLGRRADGGAGRLADRVVGGRPPAAPP